MSECKNSVIKRLNYKYHQKSSEFRLLQNDHSKTKEFIDDLQKEQSKQSSEMLSMRATLSYFNSKPPYEESPD